MPGIASAATAIVIGHVAAGTQRIRVGSGGVMLPNHAPLVVAEQFGTLETLFPDRIDLGLGRAPGTDGATARALRRYFEGADQFPRDVVELIQWFEPAAENQPVRAVPGAGLRVPIWLLGSSLFSAQLAGQLGLPYAFASHFAPELLLEALALYRRSFTPSDRLAQPHAMAAINVFAADTDAEGVRLSTSMQQSFARLSTGKPGKLPPPVDDIATVLDAPTDRGRQRPPALFRRRRARDGQETAGRLHRLDRRGRADGHRHGLRQRRPHPQPGNRRRGARAVGTGASGLKAHRPFTGPQSQGLS